VLDVLTFPGVATGVAGVPARDDQGFKTGVLEGALDFCGSMIGVDGWLFELTFGVTDWCG